MRDRSVLRGRQVEVRDPIASARRYDYADAFELRLPGPDQYLPAEWVRAGLDDVPAWVDRVAGLLGFGEKPESSERSSEYLSGFRIVESTPKMVHLETSLPLMHVVLVGRNVEPTRRTLTSILYFERPLPARLVWSVVGIGHRWAARRAIASKVGHALQSGDEIAEHSSREMRT